MAASNSEVEADSLYYVFTFSKGDILWENDNRFGDLLTLSLSSDVPLAGFLWRFLRCISSRSMPSFCLFCEISHFAIFLLNKI